MVGAAALAVHGSTRAAAAAALLVGLALANHHLLALAAALPLLLLIRRPRAAPLALVLGVLALALGTYLWLPLRARAAPLVNWGDPQTFDRFLWVVTARAFQKSVHRVSSGSVTFELVRELGFVPALTALGGLAAL